MGELNTASIMQYYLSTWFLKQRTDRKIRVRARHRPTSGGFQNIFGVARICLPPNRAKSNHYLIAAASEP